MKDTPIEIVWVTRGQTLFKDPAAVLSVGFDWADALVKTGATMASSTWSVSSRDVGLRVEHATVDARRTSVQLTGGESGQKFVLTNRVTTTSRTAATIDRAVVIAVVTGGLPNHAS